MLASETISDEWRNYILISQLDNGGPPKSCNADSNSAEDTKLIN